MAGDLLTGPGQIQWGELLLGAGTAYRWGTLTGWEETPGLDSGTVLLPGQHGGAPGALLAQTRIVTVDDLMIRAGGGTIGAAVAALGRATALDQVEQDLAVWLDDRGPLLIRARVLRRSVPVARGYRLGTVLGCAVQWEATDPRRYSLAGQSASTPLPTAEDGLDWAAGTGLDWAEGGAEGLDWGGVGDDGTVTVASSGDAPAHPVITITGPVTTPSVANLTSGDVLEYDVTLTAGEQLVIDTRAETVTLNGTAPRLGTATARSTPEVEFVIPPGAGALAYRAASPADPATAATITWRDAYW